MNKKTVLESFQEFKEIKVGDGSKTVEELLPYFCKNVEEALQRLEQIDNAEPSEALKDFKYLINCNFGLKFSINIREQNCKYNVSQSLIKAQELEKENAKYKQLEDQIGCPLDVAVDILLTLKSNMSIDYDSYDNGDESETFEYVDFNGEGLQFNDVETENKIIEWVKSTNQNKEE